MIYTNKHKLQHTPTKHTRASNHHCSTVAPSFTAACVSCASSTSGLFFINSLSTSGNSLSHGVCVKCLSSVATGRMSGRGDVVVLLTCGSLISDSGSGEETPVGYNKRN